MGLAMVLSSFGTTEMKEFTFTPASNGVNTVKMTTPGVGLFAKVSAYEKQFSALPGSRTKIDVVCGSNDFTLTKNQNEVPIDEMTITTETEGIRPAQILSVTLNNKMKLVRIKESPPISLARGTEKTVSDTVKVRHAVTIASKWRVEAEVKAAVDVVWASAKIRVKTEIEKATNQTYAEETERRRSVTLKGDGSSKVIVVWVEYYRTGTTTMMVNGREVEVPFEFKEDFDLTTEDAE
jgi:hypothetical protein